MTACKNCKTNFSGNFCNNCGQSAETHPINFHYLWHDIQHGVFHFDKGLFFTIRELFVRPGEAIREFIYGKRVSHFKPVAMVFLLGSIYGLLYHYFDIGTPHQFTADADSKTVAINNLVNNWMASHYALATMLMLPFVSISSYWAFYKTGYNLVEHFVMNSFITAQKLVVSLLLFPFLYATNKTPEMLSVISVTMFIDFLLTLWTYNQFFETQSRLKNILKTLLSYFILCVFMAIAILVTVIVMLLTNPHLL
ncbi:DUF3667 domain-containing protein [Flavobacterium soli]|uniref:DUF3667 domain-containing protein n=1 Tax=Flavobacterium soli TaxID=344881 RepID=UPI0003FAFD3D|nr:DUF3667 domain-containing protein [Flavobacterium soli]